MPLSARVLNPLPAVTQLLTSGAALNPSNRYAACGPPARKATGMSRPIDGDGTSRLSKPAAVVVPVEPEIRPAARHPTASAIAESRRTLIDTLFILASLVHRSHGVELRDEPSTVDLLETDAHTRRALGGRIVADGGGLVDENQYHRVLSGRRHRGCRRDGGQRRNVLLLRPGSYDVVDKLGVLLAEGLGETVGSSLQVAVYGFGLVRQDRNGALGGRPHRCLCGRARFPRRAVEPFQVTDPESENQRQYRQSCNQQRCPGEPAGLLDRRFGRLVFPFSFSFSDFEVEQTRLVSRLRLIGQVIALDEIVERRLVGDWVSVVGHRGVLLLRRQCGSSTHGT